MRRRRSASHRGSTERPRGRALALCVLPSRRFKIQTILALAAAAVGLVSIVSALAADLTSDSDLVRGVLPEGAVRVAGTAAVAFGLALVWLSRGLVRRKRNAWKLALVLVIGTAISHLLKGLDLEEVAASAAVLAALIRFRETFDVEADPAALKPLLRVLLAIGSLGGVLAARSVAVLSFPDRLADALAILAAALVARALYLWLRPIAGEIQQSTHARSQAERIVSASGCDTLSFFALRQDKSYFFSPTGNTFLAYRVVHGIALVSGDPIGAPEEIEELVREFRRVADVRGWRCAILASSAELLPLYRSLGLKSIYLGDEAIVRPERFSLDGRAIRKVRQSVHRLERSGYRTRLFSTGQVDAELAEKLCAVSAEWRGRQPERGFTMAMDGLFAYPDSVIAVAQREDGEVGGFIHLVPVPATGGYSLATMRRRRDVPNGLMEFLLVRTIAWARERNVAELSLNFSVFGELIRDPRSRPRAVVRFALLRCDSMFQIDRLLRFNRKFSPEWRRRYVC